VEPAVKRVKLDPEPTWEMHLDGRPKNEWCGTRPECGPWIIDQVVKIGQRRTALYTKGELRKR
jgi:hypothetical protein